MAIYWLSTLDPDETGFFQVDWTDEMDAAGDTINGTPTFTFIDANVYGLQVSSVSIASGSKKVNCYISNSDPATNRTDVLANSPYLITHEISTAGGQTLQRVLALAVDERGGQLTVETGSGSSSSDSYISVENADLYHVNHGNSDWTGTDSEKSRALRRATQFLDARYRSRWKGTKTVAEQALTWPRDSMYDEDSNSIDSDTIPQAIKDATCELARALPYTQKIDSSKGIKRVKAGSVEVEYAIEGKDREVLDLADELVSPFLKPSGILVRA